MHSPFPGFTLRTALAFGSTWHSDEAGAQGQHGMMDVCMHHGTRVTERGYYGAQSTIPSSSISSEPEGICLPSAPRFAFAPSHSRQTMHQKLYLAAAHVFVRAMPLHAPERPCYTCRLCTTHRCFPVQGSAAISADRSGAITTNIVLVVVWWW
jgi:hypothetical protein